MVMGTRRGSKVGSTRAQQATLQLLQLNEDVIWAIVSTLHFWEARNLGRTCRTLYRLCTRKLLRAPVLPIGIRLTSFTSFVLADPGNHLPWIRSMTLVGRSARGLVDTVGTDAIIDVLRALRPYHLLCFRLRPYWHWDGMAPWFHAVCSALAELPSLIDVFLDVLKVASRSKLAGERLCSGLQLPTGLRTLEIEGLPFDDDPRRTLTFFQRMLGLQKLETLALSNLQIPSAARRDYDSEGMCWPTVKRLHIRRGVVCVSIISRMFPNVHHVKTVGVDGEAVDTSAHAAIWKSLDMLSVDRIDGMLAGVQSPTRTLEIIRCEWHRSPSSLADLAPYIRALQPLFLRLSWPMAYEPPPWITIAPALQAAHTRRLEVWLRCDDHIVWNWANDVAPSLATSSLVAATIITTSPKFPELSWHTKASQVLATEIPTLEYLAVARDVWGDDDGDDLWWVVDRQDHSASLMEVSRGEWEMKVEQSLKRMEHGPQDAQG